MKYGQGKMETTKEGALRESNEGRGRFDLLPYEAMEALAKWYEAGCKKYDDRNWEKGLSVKDCINRMIRHSIKAGNGWTDEDHLSAVMWNAAAAITVLKRFPKSNDHPFFNTASDYSMNTNYMKEVDLSTDSKPTKEELSNQIKENVEEVMIYGHSWSDELKVDSELEKLQYTTFSNILVQIKDHKPKQSMGENAAELGLLYKYVLRFKETHKHLDEILSLEIHMNLANEINAGKYDMEETFQIFIDLYTGKSLPEDFNR